MSNRPQVEGRESFAERDLETRFGRENTDRLCQEWVAREGLETVIGDRKFVVALIDGNDELSDIGRSVEMNVFKARFGRNLSSWAQEYAPYDSSTTFLSLIDVQAPGKPRVAGSLRTISYSEELGLKSINDFLDPDNPWHTDIQAAYFQEGEAYDEQEAWGRLCRGIGRYIDPKATHDVSTISVYDEYKSHGALDGVSIGLYHSSLRFSVSEGKDGFMTIQEVVPLEIIQNFGKPFKFFPGIHAHPFGGGDNDTMPTYAFFDTGFDEIRQRDSLVGQVLIDGVGLEQEFLLLQEQNPDRFTLNK